MGPTLRDWRHILAHAVSTTLSIPEAGHRFECFQWGMSKLPTVLPFGVVQQGGTGTYFDATPDSRYSTVCLGTAAFTIWLAAADPGSESAADTLDDLVWQLFRSRLAVVADDPLWSALPPELPVLETASDPGPSDIGGLKVMAVRISLQVPVHP